MKTTNRQRYEMLIGVRDFGLTNVAEFPEQTYGHQLFAEVAAAITAVELSATNQSSGINAAMVGTASKDTLREELLDALTMINRTARAMALDTPGLENKFRMPRTGGDQALLTAARVFATDAEPMRDAFVKHELRADFLDELRANIADFEKTLSQRKTATGAHVEATVSIDKSIEIGLKAARKLDAVVRNKFHDDAAKLAAWATASHIVRPSRTAPPEPPKKPEPPQQ